MSALEVSSQNDAIEDDALMPSAQGQDEEDMDALEDSSQNEAIEDDALMPALPALTSEQMRNMHSLVDANKDGKASFAEILAYSTKMRQQQEQKNVVSILDEMDTNKDGKVSLEELLNNMNLEELLPDEEDK